MAKIQRNNPVGADAIITLHQNYLFNKVKVNSLPIPNWESYDRAYKNPAQSGDGMIPEYFTGGKDYKEVFYNDKYYMSSFYILGESATIVKNTAENDLSLIVQADLKRIYPLIQHRADEELRNLFTHLCINAPLFDVITFVNVETGIDRVFREFTQSGIKLEDMSSKHCFRLNFKVKYTPECCTNC